MASLFPLTGVGVLRTLLRIWRLKRARISEAQCLQFLRPEQGCRSRFRCARRTNSRGKLPTSESIKHPINQQAIVAAASYPDPLDPDEADDVAVVTTRRGLIRLALAASETAARFEREGIGHDAMAWMLAPRRLYGGGSAMDACLEQQACLRTVLLHGLSMGLDAQPHDVDELIDHDVDDDLREVCSDPDESRPVHSSPKLFTATLERRSDREIVQRFDAIIADSMCDALVVLRGAMLEFG